jgi:hypothetical protein
VLEAAIAAAHEEAAGDEDAPGEDGGADAKDAAAGDVPALTLDDALEKRRQQGVDVDGMTEGLGKAESIRDLTASLAETLFGDAEFEAIAAQVKANPPPGNEAPEQTAEPDKAAAPDNPVALDDAAAAGESTAASETTAAGTPAEKDPSLVLELVEDTAVSEAVDPAGSSPKQQGDTGEFDMTVSKRLEMVKILNQGSPDLTKIEAGKDKAAEPARKSDESQPQSIEDQMKTEMTATLKTLSSADGPPSPLEEGDDEPKEKKTGLFSRFGRSS